MATGAKPRLVNLVEASAKKHISIGLVFAGAVGVGVWYNVVKARKDAYRSFYEKYDAEAAYARMRQYGYFQSVPKGGFSPSSDEDSKTKDAGKEAPPPPPAAAAEKKDDHVVKAATASEPKATSNEVQATTTTKEEKKPEKLEKKSDFDDEAFVCDLYNQAQKADKN